MPAVLEALDVQSTAAHTSAPAERMVSVERDMLDRFPVPTLRVETDDGYDPSLEAILEFATRPVPGGP